LTGQEQIRHENKWREFDCGGEADEVATPTRKDQGHVGNDRERQEDIHLSQEERLSDGVEETNGSDQNHGPPQNATSLERGTRYEKADGEDTEQRNETQQGKEDLVEAKGQVSEG
jgi:hypothetical protein